MSEKGFVFYPKEGAMRVPALLVASHKILLEDLSKPIEQLKNVATLPGIVGYSLAMPDIHWGYGFPIGGVAAFDLETGVISPGGVGYDINCGVRLAVLDREINEKEKDRLINALFELIPSGVGRGSGKKDETSDRDYERLCHEGARFSLERGEAFPEDLESTESYGKIAGADLSHVSQEAKNRGRDQLGSIGSGNHFVEVGTVEEIFNSEIAALWGIRKGMTSLLIHSGSRGFGHQICQDTLDFYMKKGLHKGLADPQLVAAPFKSHEGQTYFASMAAAANFAFNNRQRILYRARMAFKKALGIDPKELRLIYDVCHNIAKVENHGGRDLLVHRKGATRAFGPGHPELAKAFQVTGQPVIVPGDMGRASFLLAGLGHPLTFASCCHGAGRHMSRIQSMKKWGDKDPVAYMKSQGVSVKATSSRTIREEMPDAYKDVTVVVEAVEEAGLAKTIARLKPSLVIKG